MGSDRLVVGNITKKSVLFIGVLARFDISVGCATTNLGGAIVRTTMAVCSRGRLNLASASEGTRVPTSTFLNLSGVEA
jgi:hypothetical protein